MKSTKMSHLQKSLMKKSNMLPPSRPMKRKDQPKDFTPLTWDKYFTECKDIEVNSNKFRIYTKGGADLEGPTLVLLHGGGYSALTWSLFTQEITKRIQCKILAIDLRGHGETHTNDDEDLSIETMSNDVLSIINHLYSGNSESEPIVFVGHSMGGALATHCAHELQKNCAGLVVIDVVEGTAMESLSSMQTFLKNRPTSFLNIEHAIQWCYRSSQTNNIESARVSMPGQIKNAVTNKLAASELVEMVVPSVATIDATIIEAQLAKQTPTGIEMITEETNEENNDEASSSSNNCETTMPPPKSLYTWRINLSNTEGHWKGWFQGLSELFLSTTAPKLLLLANIAGLDTSLTVGQMQGKFQMMVLPKCGHAIQEDLPDRVADTIATYLVRQKITLALCDFTVMLPGC